MITQFQQLTGDARRIARAIVNADQSLDVDELVNQLKISRSRIIQTARDVDGLGYHPCSDRVYRSHYLNLTEARRVLNG